MNTVVQCSHFAPGETEQRGRCAIGVKGGRPLVAYCLHKCTDYDGPDRGLGDTIARATAAVGIRKCGGCAKRQTIANTIIPYRAST